MIYLASDHRGYPLKEKLKIFLEEYNHPFEDAGSFSYDKDDDYVDFAGAACEKIAQHPGEHRGIFVCGSGHGMDIVANKYKGIRAALGFNVDVAKQSREHEDANILILASDWIEQGEARDIVSTWLSTQFSKEERHIRRLGKIAKIEEKKCK